MDMGATPHEGGTTFRVWAPFATAVAVAGTFNDWSAAANPLVREGDVWSADVAKATIGDHYKFVITAAGGEVLWKNDPYAREVTASNGDSVIADPNFHWQNTEFTCPPRERLVIYELHVGTFAFDPQSPIGRGTFRSIRARLPYLADLGVNAILIMAAGEFPTDRSWGYNPSHIFAIESSYGGPNGFRELVDAANGHGIAVILDVVYNHFGPTDLDLWRFDGWAPNATGGGIYFYNDPPRSTTDWGARPDYGRPEVRRFIIDSATRWVDSRGADGLRWDATAYIRNAFGRNDDPFNDIPEGWRLMQEANDAVAERAPAAVRIAEDMRENEWITKPTSEGGAGFTAQWGAELVHAIRRNVIEREDGPRSMAEVARVVARTYNGDPFARVIYTESHDEVANGHARVPEEIWPGNAASWYSKKRSTLGAAIVFTAPGVPMIFQGQEFLEDRWFDDGREVDWSKLLRFAGIHRLYRDLIRLRLSLFTARDTDVFHVNDADKVIAYRRGSAVVVANFANRAYERYEIPAPHPGWWRVRFNSDWSGYDPEFGNAPSFDAQAFDGRMAVGIGPYTAVILVHET